MKELDDPPAWFSRAAIEQIARCVSNVTAPKGASVASVLLAMFAEGSRLDLANVTYFDDLREQELVGTLNAGNSHEFYKFAGFLELGTRVGYLKLEDWNESKLFHEKLIAFAKEESANDHPADLTLVNDLLARMGGKSSSGKHDKSAFYSFASLLALEGSIRRDWYALEFLQQTRSQWQPGDDLGFLLSPQTFAEAFAQGAIGGVKTRAPEGGLTTLRYLEWLADILRRVNKMEGLAEAFVRQARWCHDTEKVIARISIWAKRMSEWSESGEDPAGEEAWADFTQSLFHIKSYVNKIRPIAAGEQGASVVEEPDFWDLKARGRIGAARREARHKALRLQQEFREALTGGETTHSGYELLQACENLANVGDVASAATILAPFEESLGENTTFQELMVRASEAETAQSEETKPAGPQIRLEHKAQQKYLSAGGME
jgi:hypothetical protein